MSKREPHPKDPKDFSPGDRVRYVPCHAGGDITHPHCEDGRVTRVRGALVFVNFGHGDTSIGCEPEQLVHLR